MGLYVLGCWLPFVLFYHTMGRSIILVEFVLLIFLPVLAAVFVPMLFMRLKSIHTGWFVLVVPVALFIYYTSFIQTTMNGGHAISTLEWIDRKSTRLNSSHVAISYAVFCLKTNI